MVPSTEHIMKKRHHSRRRLRFMSLVLLLIASITVCWWLMMSLVTGRPWSFLPYVSFALGFVPPAVLLWVFDGRLARVLVPLPTGCCPRCEYDLTGLTRAQCPECGLPVPEAFVSQPTSPGTDAGGA